jgi:voltage-gated potassium channel
MTRREDGARRALTARLWPQAPIGALLVFTGVLNATSGLRVPGLGDVSSLLVRAEPLSELGRELSFAVLGRGVQALLGAGMIVTGVGLFWRLRSAWAFSILLLLAAASVDAVARRPPLDVLPAGLSLAALLIWRARFAHSSRIGAYLMSFFGLIAVVGYGILGSLLLGSGFSPPIADVYTALYFTVATLSTLGTSIMPVAPAAKLFVVTLIIAGVGVFTTAVMTALGPLLSHRVGSILFGRERGK